jgi:CBS domain-containing protein
MTVEKILRGKGRRVITASPDATITEVARILKAERIGAVVVTADGRHVAGILSERDIVHAVADRGPSVLSTPIEEIMTREVITCTVRDKIHKIMGTISQGHFRHVPVVDEDGLLCGMISIGDVVKSHIEEVEAEAAALKDFIAGR